MKTESLNLQERSLNKSKTDCTSIAGVLFQKSLYIKQLTLNYLENSVRIKSSHLSIVHHRLTGS